MIDRLGRRLRRKPVTAPRVLVPGKKKRRSRSLRDWLRRLTRSLTPGCLLISEG
jgi:hypothetical protein